MAALRRLLYGWESQDKETGAWFNKAAQVTWTTIPPYNLLKIE